MGATIGGIYCDELVNEYDETLELLGGPGSTKGWICNWEDRFAVAKGFLGLAGTSRIGGVITLETPQPHPEYPTTYAHSIRIKGYGPPIQGTRQLAFTKAVIYVTYRTLPWSFNPGDSAFNQIDPSHPYVYAEQSLSSSSEYLPIPGYGCKWATSGLYLKQPAYLRLVYVEMEITLKQIPYMPTPEAYAASGLINNNVYLGVATGCLQFNGISTKQSAVSDGTYVQEATYRFIARNVRWDYQYDPDQQKFDQVTFKFADGGGPLIQAIDLSTVIPSYYQY